MGRGYSSPSHVLAAAAAGFEHHVIEEGGDPDVILGDLGLSSADILEPTKPMALSTYCTMLENAAANTRNRNFGLTYGRAFQPEMLGLVGFVALASPNAGAALQNFIELFPCHQNGTETRIAFAGDLVRMEYRILDPEIVERRQDAEFTMGIFANLVRRCLGSQWMPVQVDFEHPAPGSSAAHYKSFDSEIAFSQRTNALVLRTSSLDAPMPNGNLALLDLLRSSLTALACPEIASDLVTRARGEIRGSLANRSVTLSSVAHTLGVPTWTLQRRLADNGLTFSGLIEEVRQDLTTVYIRQNHIPLSEIALLLGYSEPSAFSRAFRQWHGMSPQAFRRGRSGTRP